MTTDDAQTQDPEEIFPGSGEKGEGEETRSPALAVFGVAILPEGNAVALVNPEDVMKIRPQREASLSDVWRACTEVAQDIDRALTAERLVMEQIRAAQQMQQEQQQQQSRLLRP